MKEQNCEDVKWVHVRIEERTLVVTEENRWVLVRMDSHPLFKADPITNVCH
jgi:hypothetical protein